jgi:hypothetical protein
MEVPEGFEVYIPRRGKRQNALPSIYISVYGRLLLNRAAHEVVGDWGVFLFNPKRQQFAIKRAVEGDPNAYVIRARKANPNSFVMSGQGFFAFFDIDCAKVRGRYRAAKVEDALVVQLPGKFSEWRR